MADPELSAVADAVRRFDPDLFAAALFAPPARREALMVLYAADIELSRAVHMGLRSDAGPIIGAMRLQFWRDAVAEAAAGEPPRAHEIAGPLAELVAAGRIDAEDMQALIDGHEAETEAEALGRAGFDAWADGRYGARTRLAARLLAPEADLSAVRATALPLGRALATGFAIRTAAAMAREGRALLPGMTAGMRAALAEGRVPDDLAALAAGEAERGQHALAEARAAGRRLSAAARPAFLPAWYAERAIRRARRDPRRALLDPPREAPGVRAGVLLLRAMLGRW